MTLEELASSGGRVVCPQCLGDFKAQVDLSGVTPSHKCAQPQTTLSEHPPLQHYCHSCGRALPGQDLNFCPYCGSALHIGGTPAGAGASLDTAPTRQDMPQTATEKQTTSGEQLSPVIGQVPYVKRYRYTPELQSHKLKQQAASPLTRVVCGVIIAALLGLFVWIIYMGHQL